MRLDRNWALLASAVLMTLPALAARTFVHIEQPAVSSAVFGAAIIGAAFLLAWAAEAAQSLISAGLAVAAVALLTILPEYAVDMTFAWKAGADPGLNDYLAGGPEPESLALPAANLTGANRLLSGLGWPVVVLIYWLKARRPVQLTPAVTPEIVVLGLAAIYSAWMFLRSEIAVYDGVVLAVLFLGYLWLVSRTGEEHSEGEVIGPPTRILSLPRPLRTATIAGMFAFAGLVVVVSAEPFADGLVHTGTRFGIDEFILVQWVAPLASEAPEMIVAVIFTLMGKPVFGMAALISAAVNQWSLLVASLPIVFSVSAGRVLALPLDERQQAEVFLTMAQILFAVVLIARLQIGKAGAATLLALFIANLFLNTAAARYYMGTAFLVIGAAVLLTRREYAVALRSRVLEFVELVRERAGVGGRRSESEIAGG